MYFLNIYQRIKSSRFYRYNKIIFYNRLKSILKRRVNNKFLFILSPPSSGSTVLHELISTSKYVSINNPFGNREGQYLPILKKIMFNNKRKWDESMDFDWKFIKKIWLKYWDRTLPILLEKSPPNLIRAKSISEIFKPLYFIISYRNPYAQCESIMRKYKKGKFLGTVIEKKKSLDITIEIAKRAIKCLKYQKRNIEIFDNVLVFSYEELVENTVEVVKKIADFLPELSDVEFNRKFKAHTSNKEGRKVINLNTKGISRLTQEQLDGFNSVFRQEKDILSFFGYELMEKIPQHIVTETKLKT